MAYALKTSNYGKHQWFLVIPVHRVYTTHCWAALHLFIHTDTRSTTGVHYVCAE